MRKKRTLSMLLFCTAYFVFLAQANNPNDEEWLFASSATGNTTGYIGDLIITNKTGKANTIWLGSYIIPPENGQQGYAIYKDEIEQVEVAAGDSYVHKLYGYCINVDLPPVSPDEALPHYLKWLSTKNFDTTFAEAWNQSKDKPETLNFNTQLEKAAPIIIEAVRQLEDQYYTWKSPLQIPDLYPGNAQRVKDGIIQQALWQYTAALQGKPYIFSAFEESIKEQEPVKDWLYKDGAESLLIDEQALNLKTYFNYQCQRLWSMIRELNFYVNSNSRKLVPDWKSNTGELQSKYIEFQDLWESVELTGYHFKAEEIEKPRPLVTDETKEKKKILPLVAGGVGAAGVVTGVVLLTIKNGCTDRSACNYDEEANRDDGSCEYGMTNCADPCNPELGCTDASACNFSMSACIEDGSCEYDNPYCADPCNPVVGCTYANACNFDEMACVEDGSCTYATSILDCDGNCLTVFDCEGTCGGLATTGTACDDGDPNTTGDVYDSNCECAGSCAALVDCAGECGGTATNDCKNVCGGTATAGTPCDDGDPNTSNEVYDDNCNCNGSCSTTIDCAGVCGGNAVMDCAGVCGGNAVMDCAGVCNGNSAIDCAGVCNGNSVIDCAGVCNGNSVIDCAGVCNGNSVIDCAGVCNGNSVIDCAGVCNGNSVVDCAGVCNGNSVIDCAGVCNGNSMVDCAGVCNGNSVIDCAGVCNGNSVIDCAGVCNGNSVIDCAGVCNGNSVVDCAGVCNGNSVIDCAGVCNGNSMVDCAGVCNGNSEIDCAGVCNGNSAIDCAGVCNGNSAIDCTGVCNGNSVLDCAGVCNGNAVVDCAGVCNGNSVVDCTGVCGGNVLPGTTCDDNNSNTHNDVIDANCLCRGSVPNCNAYSGTVQFCSNTGNNNYYLFNVNGFLFDPLFDLVNNECSFFYKYLGYEGQNVKFDYVEIDTVLSCNLNAKPIMLTCLEVESNANCSEQYGSLFYTSCNSEYALIELDGGKIIDPWNSYNCKYFYSATGERNYPEGQRFKLDYGKANFDYPCDSNVEAVILTCIEALDCPDACDPACLKTGTIRFNENCMTNIVRGCKTRPYYLIEYGEKLLSAQLNSEDKCFYGYDGQTIKFNFEVVPENEIDASYICSDIATPVEVTCFIPEEGNCENKAAKIKFLDCSCINDTVAFLETPSGEILEFFTPDCSSINITYDEGDVYKLDYYEGAIEPGCSIADNLVVVTCMEKIVVAKTEEIKPNESKILNLSPYTENRLITTPIQHSEFPETNVITNILGINYNQPITPTIFIENQTAVGYLPTSDLYFLNNKLTLNAKNKQLPIHYGLGLNSNQLTEIPNLSNWQSELIWNVGFKVPVFKKFQVEAEVFKTFQLEDDPNFSLRIIYKKEAKKEKLNLIKPLKD